MLKLLCFSSSIAAKAPRASPYIHTDGLPGSRNPVFDSSRASIRASVAAIACANSATACKFCALLSVEE